MRSREVAPPPRAAAQRRQEPLRPEPLEQLPGSALQRQEHPRREPRELLERLRLERREHPGRPRLEHPEQRALEREPLALARALLEPRPREAWGRTWGQPRPGGVAR